MKLHRVSATVAVLLAASITQAQASPFDVMSIFLNTDSTDNVSLRIDLSNRDVDPRFEFFESITIIRPGQIDVFSIPDVTVVFGNTAGFGWAEGVGSNPDQLYSPAFTVRKAYTEPDYGDLWFYVGIVGRTFFNNSGQNTGSFVWANETDWPRRFSSGHDPLFDHFEVIPVPPTLWLLGSGFAGLVGLRCKRKRHKRA